MMAAPAAVDDLFGVTDPCFDAHNWSGSPENEFDGPWMVLDDSAFINPKQELDLFTAFQPDTTSTSLAFEMFSSLLHIYRERVSDLQPSEDIPNVLDDCSYSTHAQTNLPSESHNRIPSPTPPPSSPSELVDDLMKLKIADRRRRNRESSSRCYYKRKRRVAGIKEALEAARRRASILAARKEALTKENEDLKKKITAINDSLNSS